MVDKALRWPARSSINASNVVNSILRSDNIDGEENDDAEAEEVAEVERPQQEQSRRQHCGTRFGYRFPRLFAILFGILIPIFVLVLISCIFGYWIAHIESPAEIQENDRRIASYTITNRKLQILSNLTRVSPKVCLNLFLNNVTTETLLSTSLVDILYKGSMEEEPSSTIASNRTAAGDIAVTPIEVLDQIEVWYASIADDTVPELYNNSSSTDAVLNIFDLYNFLQLCGDKFRSFVYNETTFTTLPPPEGSINYGVTAVPVLYFSWNRCTPYQFVEQTKFMLSLHPVNQSQ